MPQAAAVIVASCRRVTQKTTVGGLVIKPVMVASA